MGQQFSAIHADRALTDTSSSFDPGADPRAFRTALSRFTTGIAVVTACTSEGPIGITVNSFTSVSLNPALVMWSPDKTSARHDLFVAADAFVIHVLSCEQRHVSDAFVRSKSAFDVIDTLPNKDGVPSFLDCLARFECHRFATHDAGDHTLIIGKVHTAHERPGDGLIFANGAYTTLSNTASAA